MLIDARTLGPAATFTADVAIVGGGAAGITLARALTGQGHEVVVIEAGGLEPDADEQALAGGAMSEATFRNGFDLDTEIPLVDTRLRQLGGTTNHWAGFCQPLRPVDFERRPHLERSGWPFGPEALDPWYRRAHDVIQLGPFRYDWAYWDDRHETGSALLDDDVVQTTVFQLKFPFSFGDAYRSELEAEPRATVLLHAHARHIAMSTDASRVETVTLTTLDGGNVEVRADAFVLAAGAIQNARLLLANRDRRPDGIGNENDLVGRHFTEHLQVPAGWMVLTPTEREMRGYEGGPVGPVSVKLGLALTDRYVADHDLLGVEFQLVADPSTAGRPLQRDGIDTTVAGRAASAVERAPRTVAYLVTLTEQELRATNRVVVDHNSPDRVGLPTVDVQWRPSTGDVAAVGHALRALAGRLGATGQGRLQEATAGFGFAPEDSGHLITTEPGADVDQLRDGAPVAFHHMCTTRMASSPREGVVDADLRVHSVPNLFIAGSGSFATGGANTPTLTLVALALRLADHLDRRVLS